MVAGTLFGEDPPARVAPGKTPPDPLDKAPADASTHVATPATDLDRLFADVDRVVHPRCEMFRFARGRLDSDEAAVAEMFGSAEYLLRNLVEFLHQHGFDPHTKTALDFASGYGRFARYFARLFDSVTVADTERDMLDFNRRFGATGFLSSPQSTEALECQTGRYDLVFCFSLFTHLSPRVWPDWFRSLFRLVADGGFFVLSTHGYELFAKLEPERFGAAEQQRDDVVFIPTNETGERLDPMYYGTTIVTERFVRAVADGIPRTRFVRRFGMGEFDRYHDVHVFQRQPEIDATVAARA